MKKSLRIFAASLALALSIGALAGCAKKDDSNTGSTGGTSSTGGSTTTGKPDTSKEVNLIYYMLGGEGVANKNVVAEMNKKLKADINATLEIKYIDWGDVATKYPLLFASGEKFDFAHASPSAAVSYFTLAAQDALVDITGMLDTVAPTLKAEIPANVWESSKHNGKIYGVPTTYSEFTPYGFVYRRDLKEKYGTEEVTSVETMEAYMDKVLAGGEFIPMKLGANDAQNLYRMFVGLTGKMIEAPGILATEPHLVATSADNYKDIVHPVFTDEFEDFVLLTRKWADKGYWSKDVMSVQEGGKDNTTNGFSGGFITHMPDWTGNFGAMAEKQPGVETDFWCFEEGQGKIRRKMGVENSTAISSTSSNPERALMAIEKFMTDESYYRLMQNGIEGVQYEVVDGTIRKPEGFDNEVNGAGFSAWAMRTDKFNVPLASEDPRRYELNGVYDGVAIDNPYVGFSFDSKPVSTELASISNVNSTIGAQLLFGKTPNDPVEALKQYRDQLEKAGVQKVIDEVKKQLESFTPVGK